MSGVERAQEESAGCPPLVRMPGERVALLGQVGAPAGLQLKEGAFVGQDAAEACWNLGDSEAPAKADAKSLFMVGFSRLAAPLLSEYLTHRRIRLGALIISA